MAWKGTLVLAGIVLRENPRRDDLKLLLDLGDVRGHPHFVGTQRGPPAATTHERSRVAKQRIICLYGEAAGDYNASWFWARP